MAREQPSGKRHCASEVFLFGKRLPLGYQVRAREAENAYIATNFWRPGRDARFAFTCRNGYDRLRATAAAHYGTNRETR
ncbi:hypothetical protein [Paraburkholderia guartelaensis]|uniref:hypothetical protein n=1 Tax=Paraburkholderia guartelaensis TaxID=2546446 RepID=UPI002AB79694|nr:hypothetical protein [Paraburkholderia guartelaensis]